MATIPAPSVPVSQVGRAAHDIGLAGLLGGNLFGRLALHPDQRRVAALRHRELHLAARGGGRLGRRVRQRGGAEPVLSTAERRLATAKDALVGVLAVTGVATGVEGMRFARRAPGGGVPLEDGDHTAPEASDSQRRAKQRLNLLGLTSLAAELGLVGVNAVLAQQAFRRPPRRRAIPWWRP